VFRGVIPGSYDLQAVEFSGEQQRSATSQITVGDSNIDGLDLAFGVHPEVKGILNIENPPVPPSQDGPSSTTSYRVSLYPEIAMPMYGVSGGEVREDRTFAFKNLLPQRYRISVYPLEGDAYVKRVAVGDKEFNDGRIDFSGGVDAGELKIIVSMSGAHMEGSVLDSKHQPSPHATVVLVPDRTEAMQRYKSGTTDQNGHYVLRGVAPGKYKLYALDQIDGGAFYDPDYMKAFENNGDSLDVTEGSKLSHDLQLIINDEAL